MALCPQLLSSRYTRMRPELARRLVSRDVAKDLESAAILLQGELLTKQGEARAQVTAISAVQF